LDRETLIAKAKDRMDSYGLAAIVANDIDTVGRTTANVIIITKDSAKDVSGTKANVADSILDVCAVL
jgi:hypothetical protein